MSDVARLRFRDPEELELFWLAVPKEGGGSIVACDRSRIEFTCLSGEDCDESDIVTAMIFYHKCTSQEIVLDRAKFAVDIDTKKFRGQYSGGPVAQQPMN